MRIRSLAIPLALAAGLAAPAAAGTLPEIRYEKYRLANGLEVILHQDRSTPIVTVNMWYHVGSKNERPGRTGFAHLFEHMMFQGSKHWNQDYFKPLQEAGGEVNGSTNTDRTNYYQTVPSNFLERALYLEADRMGFLLDAMTQEKLDNQRDVVKNERRQRYENVPYGTAFEVLMEAAFPKGHPYSWLTIGSMDDLSAASLEDVKDFFRRYYTPNNATLVVAGDFEPQAAKDLVEKHFGALPPGPPVWKFDTWVPRLEGEKRVSMQDRVQLPRVTLLWHTVPIFTPDDAALDVLAYALARGKSSRLYQSLVHTRQIAQDVNAYQDSRQIAGTFQVVATARAGQSVAEVEKAALAELRRAQTEGITAAELSRIVNSIEADYVRDLQRLGTVADRLNLYNHHLGEPSAFETDLARYRKVTLEDVKRVANTYLGPARVALTVEPMVKAAPSASELAKSVDRTVLPGPGPVPSVKLPKLERERLPNGIELVVAEHHELPILELSLVVGAGSAANPKGRPGLANLTAQMLDEGTTTRSSVQIAEELDAIGATLSLATDPDTSTASLSTLKKHADKGMTLLADVVTRPAFVPDELERVRKQLLTRLLQDKDSAGAIATRATLRALYGDGHPYGEADLGTEEALKAATTDEVRAFWSERWRPESATLIVVGDTTLAEARALAASAFGNWARGSGSAPPPMPEQAQPGERVVYLADRPGAAQSVVSVAQIGITYKAPDLFPALVMNAAYGGMFMSRLNLNLREAKGYTYGARSGWEFRKSPGPFSSGAGVQTKVTRESIAETLKELDELRATRPLTAEELDYAKNSIVRGFAQRFETPGQIAGQIRTLVVNGLPDDFFDSYVARISAVTVEEANRVARERLKPESSAVVVVGDAATIRKGLEELKLGRIVELDAYGKPLR